MKIWRPVKDSANFAVAPTEPGSAYAGWAKKPKNIGQA